MMGSKIEWNNMKYELKWYSSSYGGMHAYMYDLWLHVFVSWYKYNS